MFFMVLARFVYAFPFLAYVALNKDMLLSNQGTFSLSLLWFSLLLISLFFFSLGKFVTWPMTHFVFLGECLIYSGIYSETGDVCFLFFIWVSSFFAIEALRNDALHVFAHLLMLLLVLVTIGRVHGIGLWSYLPSSAQALVAVSPLFCRSMMSIMESKNVVLRRVFKQNDIYVPVIDDSVSDKLKAEYQVEVERLSSVCETLKEQVTNLESRNHELEQELIREESSHSLSLDIANKYFQMASANLFNLSLSADENIDNLLLLSKRILGAKYVALFEKDEDTANLTNSVGEVDEQDFVEKMSPQVFDVISSGRLSTKEDLPEYFGMSWVGFVPCTVGNEVNGVLVFAFETMDDVKNVHCANLMLMSAVRAAEIMGNREVFSEPKK